VEDDMGAGVFAGGRVTNFQCPAVVCIECRFNILGRVSIIQIHARVVDQDIESIVFMLDCLGQAAYGTRVGDIEGGVSDSDGGGAGFEV